MRYKIVKGEIYTFLQVSEIETKEDIEVWESIKENVVTRIEYDPFKFGPNKRMKSDYIFFDCFFPATFTFDICEHVKKITGEDIYVENEETLYNFDINETEFYDYIANKKLPEEIDTVSEKYRYQLDTVYRAIKFKTSIGNIGVGGGKTIISYLYYCTLRDFGFIGNSEQVLKTKARKMLVIVPTQELCKQLKNDYAFYDKYSDEKIIVETIYSGSKRIANANVVVGTFTSLCEFEESYFEDFFVCVCDELHRAKAYSIREKIYPKLKCEYLLGLTGTMPDSKTIDYLHITSMFGPVILRRKLWQNIEAGVSTKVRVFCIQMNYDRSEYSDFSKKLKQVGIIGSEKYALERAFFHNYEQRNNLIISLLQNYEGNSLLLCDSIDYCQLLYDLLSEQVPEFTFNIITGKVKNKTEIIQKLKNDTVGKYEGIIATTQTMSTGVSINSLQNIYNLDGGRSWIKLGQGLGRGVRLFEGKEYCNVFDFWDMLRDSGFSSQAVERKKYYEIEKLPYYIVSKIFK